MGIKEDWNKLPRLKKLLVALVLVALYPIGILVLLIYLYESYTEKKNLQVCSYHAANSNVYIGAQVSIKHVEQTKKEILDSNELLEGIFFGHVTPTHGSGGAPISDYLIVTNKRVILWGRGIFSKNIETIDYDKITNIESHHGMMLGAITFNLHGAKEHFNYMVKTDLPIAVKMIEKHIYSLKKDKQTLEEKLSELNRLLEKGVITTAEYKTQRKRVLNS